MATIIQAYKCDYCNHISARKGSITRHERNCNHNPATRACITCVHFSNFDGERPSHYEFGKAVDVSYRGMWCAGIADDDYPALELEPFMGIELEALRKNCEIWQAK